jgi:transcriptional regulator with XRE-family HTH domain
MPEYEPNPDRGAALRAFVQELVAKRYDGNITHAAKAMGISHPYLSQYLNKRTGAGRKLTRALSTLTGQSLDELERLAADDGDHEPPAEVLTAMSATQPQAPPELPAKHDRPSVISRAAERRPGEAWSLEGWDSALISAVRERPDLPSWSLVAAGPIGVEPLKIKRATPELVAHLAELVRQHADPAERQRLEAVDAERYAENSRTIAISSAIYRRNQAPKAQQEMEDDVEKVGKHDTFDLPEPTRLDASVSADEKLDLEQIRAEVRLLLESGRIVAFGDSEARAMVPGPKVAILRFAGHGAPESRIKFALNRAAEDLIIGRLRQRAGST